MSAAEQICSSLQRREATALVASTDQARHYFGLELRRLLSLTALRAGPDYLADLVRRQIAFPSSIVNAGDKHITDSLSIR
jgi:predicted DNA-binding transcriptional regulator YafY